MKRYVEIIILFFFVATTCSFAEILKVPYIYPDIQAAIDDSNNGDIVLVEDGTYTGDGNRDIDFDGKVITVKSENGPQTCIIDCNGTYENPHRGFYFHNNEDANSILQGFAITNGYTSLGGGGIECYMCSPKIMDCIITRNTAHEGGGISVTSSNSTIINCIVSGNYAYLGGGVYTSGYRSNTVFTNSIISGNSAEKGGGIYATRDSAFNNCTIYGNYSYASGGGMYLSGGVGDTASISNCIVWGNRDIAVNEEMGNQIYANTGGVSGSMTIKAYYCSIQNGPNDLDIPEIPYESIMVGNWISEVPNFANPGHWETNDTPYRYNDDYWVEGDYHLKSQAGRWNPDTQSWVQDDITSPCIDIGDPNSPIGLEPFPNGGFINMGAYGGTNEASKSYFNKPVCKTIIAGDINGDCKVDEIDLEILMLHWLEDIN